VRAQAERLLDAAILSNGDVNEKFIVVAR
jgi:hypothetical protein